MKKKALLLLSFMLIGLAWLPVRSAAAYPARQGAVVTPTPGADGRILYTVKANDTCLSISLLMGVSLDELRRLNNLQAECLIRQGQKLLLGIVPTATPAPMAGSGATATPLRPTTTPFNGTAQVCVLLYEDVNGNAMREEMEPAIADGAVSLVDRTGKYSKTLTTTSGITPVCFDDVPEGDYNLSAAAPQGYNATTSMNYPLKVIAGDKATINFGAQRSAQAAPPPAAEEGHSPILGILGGVLLLGGAGLGLYVRFGGRQTIK